MTAVRTVRNVESRRGEEAAAWHARLNSAEPTEKDFLAFEAWVSDPDNRLLYDRVERLLIAVEASRADWRRGLTGDVVTSIKDKWKGWTWRLWLGGAFAATAVAILAIVVATPPEAVSWTSYATTKDGTRTVSLEDGSSLQINRGSAIRVALEKRVRRVSMSDAEVFFSVAHDAERPFVIDVGGDQVTVVGTEFNILRYEEQTVITVNEGVVSVIALVGGGRPESIILRPGDQMMHEKGGGLIVARRIGSGASMAWRFGHLVYEDAPLRQIVADLNRYYSRTVRIDGVGTENMKFSGSLAIDTEDGMIQRLQAFLPLDVTRSEEDIVLRRRLGR